MEMILSASADHFASVLILGLLIPQKSYKSLKEKSFYIWQQSTEL